MRTTTGAMRPALVTMITDRERTTTATTISVEETTITAETTPGEMTIIAATMITTERRIIVGTTIGTANNHGTPKGITGRKMSTSSNGALRTTIDEGLDPQGPNHSDQRNSKSSNWYP